jgi:hypothetical protein
MLSCPDSPLLLPNVPKAALRSADEQTSAKHEFRANSGLSPTSNEGDSPFFSARSQYTAIHSLVAETAVLTDRRVSPL